MATIIKETLIIKRHNHIKLRTKRMFWEKENNSQAIVKSTSHLNMQYNCKYF